MNPFTRLRKTFNNSQNRGTAEFLHTIGVGGLKVGKTAKSRAPQVKAIVKKWRDNKRLSPSLFKESIKVAALRMETARKLKKARKQRAKANSEIKRLTQK